MIDHAPYLPTFGHYSRFSSSHGAGTQANGYGLAAYHLGLSGQDHLADHSGAGPSMGRKRLQEPLGMFKISVVPRQIQSQISPSKSHLPAKSLLLCSSCSLNPHH